jgi:GDP-L-fucose synthase
MKRILVTGSSGMVGSAFQNINLPRNYDFLFAGSKECDLRHRENTFDMFQGLQPDYVIHLAARVGGVKGNTDYVADFYSENVRMNTNVLDAAHLTGVKKVISLLSTCVYPDSAAYPLTENQIQNGEPHKSNFGYAYAKRMLDVQSRAYRQQHGCNFITAVPNNLYGENDNFHLTDGHVIPALIRKVFEAWVNADPSVTFWGTGSPLREFTYSKDIARILLFLLENYNDPNPINIGTTGEVSIREVAETIIGYIGFTGDVIWDTDMPTGQHRKPSSNKKLLDLGWNDYTDFNTGLMNSCEWFKENYPNVRGIYLNSRE